MNRFQPKIFALAILLNFFALFFLLGSTELVLRAIGFRFSLPILEDLGARKILVPSEPGFVKVAEDLTDDYAYGMRFVPMDSEPIALKKNPADYRVVMVADSTGGVFEANKHFLLDCLNRRVEFINLSFVSCGSERSLATVREALALKPDALIVATGHSDFVSQCNANAWSISAEMAQQHYSKPFRLAFQKLRVVQLFAKLSTRTMRLYTSLEGKRIAASRVVRPYTSADIARYDRNFEANIRQIAREAKQQGVAVYLSTMAYNYDFPPSGTPRESGEENSARKMYEAGLKLRSEKKFKEARKVLDESYAVSERPHTISYVMNESVRRVAASEGVHLVDLKAAIDRKSPMGFAGNSLMADHCHLNPEGNIIFARELCLAMGGKK